jgi:hypothetical protein
LKKTATSDELDAATAALVGRWFLLDQGIMLGGNSGILIPAVGGHHGKSMNRNGSEVKARS